MSDHPNIESLPLARTAGLLFSVVALLHVGLHAESETRKEKPVVLDTVVVDAAKTHTLFMGADISVNLDKDLYPVRDVAGTSWVIDINGKDRVVSAKKGPLNLKITPNLKLTEVSATIVGFRKMAAYSYDNDPSVLITRGLTKAAQTTAIFQGIANDAQARADTASNTALGGAALMANSDSQFGANALLTSAQNLPAVAHPGTPVQGSRLPPVSGATATTTTSTFGNNIIPGHDPSGNLSNPYAFLHDASRVLNDEMSQVGAANAQVQTENGLEPAGRLVTRGLDALDVEFSISAVRPLLNPYIVTLARIRTPGSKPGFVQNHIYARALDPIDSHLSVVHFTEEGFPPMYELLDFQVHIYDRGVEIATNLASNRVELTREEAFEYVKMEYVSAHKGETLQAVPVMGKLPAELPNRIAAGKYTETFFVPVSKDGLGHEAFSDRVCSRKIEDPFLYEVISGLRFKPALANGRPVEGVAAVNLTKLQF